MKEYKLSELFDLQMGKTPDRKNKSFWNNGVSEWISIADLSKNKKYISKTKEKISIEAIEQSGIKSIPKNTVVMSFKLSIGKTAIVVKEMYSNEAIMAFINKGIIDISSDYLYYLLKQKNWNEITNKAVMGKTLNKATLSNVKIKIHDKEKQKQIVSILDTVSGIIEKRKKQLEDLDELVKARFVEMFGDPISNSKHLPTLKFIDVVKMQRGFDLPVSKRNRQGNVPVYGANGILDNHDVARVYSGGIITGRSGTIGDVYYTENDFWPLNTSLFSVDLHGNNIIFLAYLLRLFDLSRFVEGTGVPTLNRNDFHNKNIIKVEIELQNQFADFVKQTEEIKEKVQKSLDETQVLFDSLMQKYFS